MRNIFIILLALLISPAAIADDVQALEIFDNMMHYEARQLRKTPGITDYHCKIQEITYREGEQIQVEKDLYFMIPTFQLQIKDNEPVYYMDDDFLIVLLDNVELTREKDASINGVECYVIHTQPLHPAYKQYNRTFFVAKDDYRHVRTNAVIAGPYDDYKIEINYEYEEFQQYYLPYKKTAKTLNPDGKLVASTDSYFLEYEFGIGLDLEFFNRWREGTRIQPPLN